MCFSNMDMMISCRPSPPSLRDKKAATFIASESQASCCCCSSFSFSPLLLHHLKSCQLVISASNFNFNSVLSVYKCWNQSSWSHSCCCCDGGCLFSKEAAAFVLQNPNPESFIGDIAVQIILHLLLLHKNQTQKKNKTNKGIMA